MKEYKAVSRNQQVDVDEEFAKQQNHFFMIPHARFAQSTDRLDWGEIELAVYGAGSSAEGLFCLPEDGELHRVSLVRDGDSFVLEDDHLRDAVEWKIRGPNQWH
jgi:hypothetical protein